MPKVSDKLTDTAIRNATPIDKLYKMFDGKGMFLQVNPNGTKYWRLKYRINGKEKLLALGVYDDVGLKDARTKRKHARDLIADGIDPVRAKKEQKRQDRIRADNSFETVAREWHAKKTKWSVKHYRRVIGTLEADIFPYVGSLPITDITPADLLEALRLIEERGALEVAARVLQRCSAVFRYAIATSRIKTNPAADLKDALEPPKKKNFPSISPEELPEFLERLDVLGGDKMTRLAIRMLMLTFVRTSELRAAEWAQFNHKEKMWRIPAENMKMGIEHLVPLSTQTLSLLEELREISGKYRLLFPGRNNINKPISENTILYGIYRMGYRGRMTGHGFRTLASTVLNEHGFESDAIERQLAHGERNKVRAAYNKAKYLDERKVIMQAWADFIEVNGT